MSYSPTLGRWTQTDPQGYVDGLNTYQAYRSSPATLVDPFGLKPPTFKGYEDPRYQKHDGLIEELVNDFNKNKQAYAGCTPEQVGKIPDLTEAMVKSWMIQETGGNDRDSRAAWEVDPTQVNVPGDWNEWKADVGLKEPTKRNEGDIKTNLKGALMYVCRKGFGGSGQPAKNRPAGFFDGWPKALERYGPPNRADFYPKRIIDRAGNPGEHYPIQQ